MAVKLTSSNAMRAIEKRGALLVYPIHNRKEPASIWSEIWPRTRMRWEWDDNGDSRVADMWHMRERLSRSRRVIYAKWYQGRATFFSERVFVNLVSYLGGTREMPMSHETALIMEALEADSPLSTKQLKAACGLEGRFLEPAYTRALKPLWNRLWIVGFGEFEDSSFPSLGIGATKTLFEDLWQEAGLIEASSAEIYLREHLGENNPFFKYGRKIKSK